MYGNTPLGLSSGRGDADCGDGCPHSAGTLRSGKSIKAIARELGIARNTVRHVLRSGETASAYERTIQPRPKLGKWITELEQRLIVNDRKSRRERLDLIRIYEGLQADGYEGGYDAVRRYARARQRRQGAAQSDAYVPLTFEPGEAYQFDWSHEVVLGIPVDLRIGSLVPAEWVTEATRRAAGRPNPAGDDRDVVRLRAFVTRLVPKVRVDEHWYGNLRGAAWSAALDEVLNHPAIWFRDAAGELPRANGRRAAVPARAVAAPRTVSEDEARAFALADPRDMARA